MDKKPRCNICKKKVPLKVKKNDVGDGVILFYVRCSKCRSVFPGYVEDDKVRGYMKKVETLQNETANKGPEEILSGYREITALKKETENLAKVLLVKRYWKEFGKLGDRVIWT